MFSSYVYKRNAPLAPPSMTKYYSVLWGTLLLDFDTEEEAKTSMSPRLISEVLGISEWVGVGGRGNQFPNGFLIVTHTGMTYYMTALSLEERNEWILHVKRALECNFANPEIVPFKPSKILQNRPPLKANTGSVYCKVCGRGFPSSEHLNETSTVLQIGAEEPEKVCSDCRSAQMCIIWMKSLNYMHLMTLHEHTPAVYEKISTFKASFKLRRRLSQRLEMATKLLEQGHVSPEEFEELRRVDHEYRREEMFEESERMKGALELIGDDMQTIISLLRNPTITDGNGRMSYYQIIHKVLKIADNDPQLLDFYWPQLIQVHLLEAGKRSQVSLMKVDLLQQALLVMSQKYCQLALKLSW